MLTLYVVNISWDDVFLCLNFYYEYLYLVPCKDFILQRRAAVNYHKHREDREEEEEERREEMRGDVWRVWEYIGMFTSNNFHLYRPRNVITQHRSLHQIWPHYLQSVTSCLLEITIQFIGESYQTDRHTSLCQHICTAPHSGKPSGHKFILICWYSQPGLQGKFLSTLGLQKFQP